SGRSRTRAGQAAPAPRRERREGPDGGDGSLRLDRVRTRLYSALSSPACVARLRARRGRSSVGRASASQAEGRGFETRRPLARAPLRAGFRGGDLFDAWRTCPRYVPRMAYDVRVAAPFRP